MGCFSGRLMSAARDQKLFCKLCSPFCCSFNEFVEEKVISPSYSSAIFKYILFVPKPSETIAPDVQPWFHKYPLAWEETAGMGLAKQRHPVLIELKAEASPVRVRQCPMSQEARRGIIPHIRWLMNARILKRCQSPWNTPLLPVKKPGGKDYKPVQDL